MRKLMVQCKGSKWNTCQLWVNGVTIVFNQLECAGNAIYLYRDDVLIAMFSKYLIEHKLRVFGTYDKDKDCFIAYELLTDNN